MKRNILLVILLLVFSVKAERIVVYDSTNGVVANSFWADPTIPVPVGTQKILVLDEFNPNLTFVLDLLNRQIDVKYWIVRSDTVSELTQCQKDSLDLVIAIADTARIRQESKNQIDEVLVTRALALITRREINILRTWTRDMMTETAAATNLANFKTRIATLSTLNGRTLQQLNNAMKSEIDTLRIKSTLTASNYRELENPVRWAWTGGLITLILGVLIWQRRRFSLF